MFRVVPFPMYLSTVGFGGYALRFEISTDKKPHYSKLIGSKRKVNKRLAEFMDAELVVADVESIRLIRNVADSLLKAIEQKPMFDSLLKHWEDERKAQGRDE